MDELLSSRQAMADAELAGYSFGEEVSVASTGAWDSQEGTDRVIYPLFMQNAKGTDAATDIGQFTVEFEQGTANVIGAYASVNGNEIGIRAEESQTSVPGM